MFTRILGNFPQENYGFVTALIGQYDRQSAIDMLWNARRAPMRALRLVTHGCNLVRPTHVALFVMVGALLVAPATELGAQRAEPVAFTHRSQTTNAFWADAPTSLHYTVTQKSDTALSGRHGGARGALWGAVAGAAVGAVTAFVIVQSADPHSDHSEDALPFLFIPLGAVVGAELGVVVGLLAGRNN